MRDRWSGDQVGSQGRRKALALPPQLRPGDVVAHLRQPQPQPLRLDRRRGRCGGSSARPRSGRQPPRQLGTAGRVADRPEQGQRRLGRGRRAPSAKARSALGRDRVDPGDRLLDRRAPGPRRSASAPAARPGPRRSPAPSAARPSSARARARARPAIMPSAARRSSSMVSSASSRIWSRAGAGVERDQPGVLVGAGLGEDRVAEPAPLAQLLEQPRGHAAAERGGVDLRGIGVVVADARRLEGERDVHLLEIARLAPLAAAKRAAATGRPRAPSRWPNSRSARGDGCVSASTAPAAATIIRSGP